MTSECQKGEYAYGKWTKVPSGTLARSGSWPLEAVKALRARTYCFDLDGTLCSQEPPERYGLSVPNAPMIEAVRRLKAEGHKIIIYTARAPSKGGDPTGTTVDQLRAWGVPYDRLYLGKPAADVYVDDRATTPELFLAEAGLAHPEHSQENYRNRIGGSMYPPRCGPSEQSGGGDVP